MRLTSFEFDGHATYGLLDQDNLLLPPREFTAQYPDLVAVLRAGALAELEQLARSSGTRVAKSSVRLLPVIPNPGKLICVGLNYKTHVAETKRGDSEHPSLFLRFNDSLAADGDEVLRPAFSSASIGKASWPSSSAKAAATSPRRTRWTTSPATPASTT